MKKRFKNSILFIALVVTASLISSGFVIAQESCPPDQCTVTAKRDSFNIEILPDANNQWPIVVNAPGDFKCGPEGDLENYPCLAWNYQCIGDDCNNIAQVYAMIPTCCDKPIKVLWTISGLPEISTCDAETNPGTTCDSSALRITPLAGGPGPLFWFTTPKEIGINAFDIIFKVGNEFLPCKVAIAGPGCNTPIPPVRVEPRVQCYQFTADTDNCQKAQTWYAEWAGTDPCAVDVWVADDMVPCDTVKTVGEKLVGEELGDIKITVDGVEQPLTEALTNNSQCDEGWLRFTNSETGCNVRCYYSGGRKYCR